MSANAISGCDAISPHTATSMSASVADLDRALDEPQHGGMQRREARREVRVAAIDGQRVLHEVVRPDAEEATSSHERVARDGGGGRLDHDAERNVARDTRRRAPRARAAASSSSCRACAHFVERDDEREHDAHVAVHRRAQQRAELRAEQLRLIEAHPDRAPAEERIRLGGESADGQLVAADVEGANDDRMSLERLERRAGTRGTARPRRASSRGRRRGTPCASARRPRRRCARRASASSGRSTFARSVMRTPSSVTASSAASSASAASATASSRCRSWYAAISSSVGLIASIPVAAVEDDALAALQLGGRRAETDDGREARASARGWRRATCACRHRSRSRRSRRDRAAP